MKPGEACPHCFGTGKVQDNRELGADLRRYREWHETTLGAVASAMGFSVSYICDLELGRRDWREDLVHRYRDAVMQTAKA